VKVFVIEDETEIADIIAHFLRKENIETLTFESAESFLEKVQELPVPQLFILDLMLPGMDGVEFLKYLKREPRYKDVPVIILSAKDDTLDIVLGLELGAEDYITKPFNLRELLARIKVVTRRISKEKTSSANLLSAGKLVLNRDTFSLQVEEKEIPLSLREYKIMELFMKNPKQVISRNQFLDRVWGEEEFVTDRIVDVYIANLRKKLGRYGQQIETVRGVGYRFVPK
jgi:DNA-binding response OmpR family regulator